MSEYSNALTVFFLKKNLRTEIYVQRNKTRSPAANSARLLSSMSFCAKKIKSSRRFKIILVFKMKQYIYKKIFLYINFYSSICHIEDLKN